MNIKDLIDPNANIIVASGKGGVGKSTFATQVAASWLYSVNGGKKVKYFEVDDVNKSALFKESEIIEASKLAVNDAIGLSMVMGDFGNCVIDIGGNKTSETVINNISENGDIEKLYWFIPLGVEEVEAKEALTTASLIKSIYQDTDVEPKIVFVLNNLILDSDAKKDDNSQEEQLKFQFANFFGSNWMPMDFVLKDNLKDPDYIFLERTTHIKISTTYFKKLLIEIGNKEFLDKMQQEKFNAKKEYLDIKQKEDSSIADVQKAKDKWESSIQIFRFCSQIKKYCEDAIYPQFQTINKALFN